jgi:CRP-like cAMP-binding protein
MWHGWRNAAASQDVRMAAEKRAVVAVARKLAVPKPRMKRLRKVRTDDDRTVEQLNREYLESRNLQMKAKARIADRDARLDDGELHEARKCNAIIAHFVLLEGEISLWKEHGDQEIVVVRGRPGAFFGEVPLLLGTPYMLSGRAERDCRLIVFQRKRFGSCCGSARRFRVRFSGHWRRVFAT